MREIPPLPGRRALALCLCAALALGGVTPLAAQPQREARDTKESFFARGRANVERNAPARDAESDTDLARISPEALRRQRDARIRWDAMVRGARSTGSTQQRACRARATARAVPR